MRILSLDVGKKKIGVAISDALGITAHPLDTIIRENKKSDLERMKKIIDAAIKNNVALEINARSGYPRERFIRMAKKMGAKFSFGTNNFKDNPIDMSRCYNAIEKYGLKKKDMYVPEPR